MDGRHGPTPTSVVLLDISRLIWRARRPGPTGIDRVELAYAQRFITGGGERPAYAVLHLCGWLFAISPAGGRRFIEHLTARWQGGRPLSRRQRLASLVKLYWPLFSSAWVAGPWLRRALRQHAGPPVFLVVSHHHVSRDHTIARIRCSLNAKTVCLIHDLLPIDYPEYFKPSWERRYQRVASVVGRRFDAAIANSESTARSLRDCLARNRDDANRGPIIRVSAPGVRTFIRSLDECARAERPCFAILGTIEPRKNHLLLLNLWTRLASTLSSPPRLLVIGARGWENEQAVDMLERSRRLRGLVEEHNGLSDAEVAALLSPAQALLQPSFAEGFGLPLAEALGSGIPVICSDIPAFREVGREVPDYLDPLDTRAWAEAVIDYSRPDSPRRAAQLSRLTSWRAPCWSEHFAVIEQLLREVQSCPLPAHLPQAPDALQSS